MEDFSKLIAELSRIDEIMLRAEADFNHLTGKVHISNKHNATNLLHYLALRSLDIRELQDELHTYGLSSMASSESHIRGQLLAILQRLGVNKNIPPEVFNYKSGKKSLADNAAALFGERPVTSGPSIMVTFESDLADDYERIKNLLQSGMNIARINCAHDDESTWFRMIQHIKRACKVTGLKCRIYMDLAGPKIRTVLKNKEKLEVKEGQTIVLTDEENMRDGKGEIGCTIPGIAAQLNAGETVLFDDGLIEARVEKAEANRVKLLVVRVSSKKPFIRNEKGINFPESALLLPALTEYDIQCLSFINKYADMVGYSFVRNAKDIIQLQEVIGKNNKLAIVIKIETPEAVKNLPELLFCVMQREHTGVMIARGDLAVEIGFERMSEIQEEILWICEAAHIPVIWATQVLENLNKSGLATRSEVTDAAYAAMADCVMINKGNYIIRTLETLRDILARSGGHHIKKRFIFRPLGIATRFMTQ
jgi:pyruvate kinase